MGSKSDNNDIEANEFDNDTDSHMNEYSLCVKSIEAVIEDNNLDKENDVPNYVVHCAPVSRPTLKAPINSKDKNQVKDKPRNLLLINLHKEAVHAPNNTPVSVDSEFFNSPSVKRKIDLSRNVNQSENNSENKDNEMANPIRLSNANPML